MSHHEVFVKRLEELRSDIEAGEVEAGVRERVRAILESRTTRLFDLSISVCGVASREWT